MPRCAKKSTSLVKAAFITLGAPATIGHDALSIAFFTKLGTCVRIGKKMYVERLLVRVVVEEQVVDVRLRRPCDGKQGSIEPYLPPSTHISSVVSSLEDDVLLLDAERLEVGAEERRRRVDVEHPRDADADAARAARRASALERRNGRVDLDALDAEEAPS